MANLTDPLIVSIQGTDPQNLLEYITRQKIYDSRYWKEECFGLTVADVLEKAATSLTCIGGTMGPNQQPTKFLCLTLKLLQILPDTETIVEDFIQQNHFKYVRVLGSFYLRLTGRPSDIYQALEPLYGDFSKLKVRERQEWKLTYMDQVVHELLTQPYFVGITLPRLPARMNLQQEGFLDDGPRQTRLEAKILKAGGLEELLRYKALVEKSPAALVLLEERMGEPIKTAKEDEESNDVDQRAINPSSGKRKATLEEDGDGSIPIKVLKKKKKEKGYGSLFKSSSSSKDKSEKHDISQESPAPSRDPEEGSEEFWNQERAKLGLKPLNSK